MASSLQRNQVDGADDMGTDKANAARLETSDSQHHAQPPLGQLWQVPVFLLGACALLAIWSTQSYWYDPLSNKIQRNLASARELLDDPRATLNAVPDLVLDALS